MLIYLIYVVKNKPGLQICAHVKRTPFTVVTAKLLTTSFPFLPLSAALFLFSLLEDEKSCNWILTEVIRAPLKVTARRDDAMTAFG